MAAIMKFFSFPALYPADTGPLTTQSRLHRIPKAFPKWWSALRLFQLWASSIVIISAIFSIKFSDQNMYSYERKHGHFEECVLLGTAFLSFLYIVTTVILRAKHPVGFAKCVPFILAGDVFMMGSFGLIKYWSAMVLRHVKGHGGGMRFFKRWGKKGCKHAGRMGKHHIKQWGKGEGWKNLWKDLKHGNLNTGEMNEMKRKTKMMGICTFRVVKTSAGIAAFLFFLTSLVALYIMITHRGQIKKHLCEVRGSLMERCRTRRMRRCAKRAARRGGKCCARLCAKPEFYPDEKKTMIGIPSVDIPVTLPVVIDSFPAGTPYIPGAFPPPPPPPPPPTQAPSPSPLSGVVTPYEQITPTSSAVQTPLRSQASTTLMSVHEDGETSTDDEFTHVEYRHVRTPSTSSGSEVGLEEEKRPLQ